MKFVALLASLLVVAACAHELSLIDDDVDASLSPSFVDAADASSADDVEFASSSSPGTVQIIVRAFIPKRLRGITTRAVPGHSDKRMFSGPMGMCWGTDDRLFSTSARASSRVYMRATYNMDTKHCSLSSRGTSGTHQYDCTSGAVKCNKRSSVSAECSHSRWYSKPRSGKYVASFEIAGGNPCAPLGIAPKANADGRIEVYPEDNKICLKASVNRFPSYEVLYRKGTSGRWRFLGGRAQDLGVSTGLLRSASVSACKVM